MDGLQLLGALIIMILLPISIGCAMHVARVLAQHLPEYQRDALERFARMAVLQIERDPAKKALARESVMLLFATFHLPPPPLAVIDIAIEAAFCELKA